MKTKAKVRLLNTKKRELPLALQDMQMRFLSTDASIIYKNKEDVTHEDLMDLIDGQTAFLVIRDMVPKSVCDLVCKSVHIDKMRGYDVLPEFLKADGAIPLYEGKDDKEAWYAWAHASQNPVIEGGLAAEAPSSIMRRFFDNTYAHGALLARVDRGRPAPFGLIRGMKGGSKIGVFTHSDSMKLDHPTTSYFSNSRAALSMVVGLNDCGPGAETSIYPVEILNQDDYSALSTDSGGIDESLLPPPQATVKVGQGAAILFNSNMLHNVSPLVNLGDVRLTCSGFAVYFEDGTDRPLALFS